jgi:hypothetical protein
MDGREVLTRLFGGAGNDGRFLGGEAVIRCKAATAMTS